MKKHVFARILCTLMATLLVAALLPLSVLSAGGDDEVVLDPFEFGEKTAFLSNLPTYDSESETVTSNGGWQVGNYDTATGAFTPFSVMDEYGIISTTGAVWGAGGGLYVTNHTGKIAISACQPTDTLTNEIRYTAEHTGRAVLNYDQILCLREGAVAEDYIAYEFSIYINGTKVWPSDADWYVYQSETTYTEADVSMDALAAVRQGGFPIAVTLAAGDVISFRTRQHNTNTWMIYENPTVTYTLIEHTHEYGEWERYDSEQHVHTCACSKQEFAPHSWDAGQEIAPPTHFEEGEMLYTCTDCGETKIVPVEKTGDHVFEGDWLPHDDAKHKRVCSCGDVDGVEYADHRWDNGEVTIPPMVGSIGEKTYTCTDCGETKTEDLPALTPTAGDVNGDGIVSNADVLCIFRYLYNTAEYPLALPEMADVNGDGDITNADVLCIFRYLYNAEQYPFYFPMSPEEENELPIDSVLGIG
ncbi:MAG: dockerin type I repeat-containing protein [Clostridia bacterium]|nr:dockerin type I repeat-containing protein [Clostridia bacterium]